MAYHRIYKYTSIGRPLKLSRTGDKAVLILMAIAAIVGATAAWQEGANGLQLARQALAFLLIVYGSWALGRELNPDDPVAAFLGMAAALFAALVVDAPGVLIVYSTLGLVRIVNRSSGLAARKSDSFLVLLLVLVLIYLTDNPFFGVVAAIAFILDGSLKDPLRHQWVFGLMCVGGTIVYMVDHDTGFIRLTAPESLFSWLALLFILIYALNILLLKSVQAKGDANDRALDFGRVRAGMAVGLFAAILGIYRPEDVVILIAVISGICFGMAFRKGFKAPATP